MRRPIVWMAVPVCLYCIFGAVLCVNFIFLLIISLVTFFVAVSFTKNEYLKKYLIFLGCFSMLALVTVNMNSRESPVVSGLDPDGIPAEVSGRVKKLNQYDDTMYVQLSNVRVTTVSDRDPDTNDLTLGQGSNADINSIVSDEKIRKDSVETKLKGVLLKAPFGDAGVGDIVTAEGALLPLDKARNEGNFDEKSYYESIGIEAVLKTKQDVRIKKTNNIFYKAADAVRRHFKASFEQVSPEYNGELSSVILGDKSSLEASVKELYSENGIAHILAISGLHISFAGLGLYKLLRKTGQDILSSTLISGLAVVCYVLLTGSSISAWRACIMFLFAAFADVKGRSYDAASALSLQAIVTLLVTPKAICGASFVMSYTAVLSIILSNEAFGNVLYRLRGSLTVLRVILSNIIAAFGVFLFMLPVTLYYYSSVPIYSPFLNLLVIPLSAILMPLGMAAGFLGRINTGAGIFFAGGAERIFDIYAFACRIMQNIPFNRLLPGKPGMLSIVLFYIFFALGFVLWKKHIEGGLKLRISNAAGKPKDIFTYFKSKGIIIVFAVVPICIAAVSMLKTKDPDFFVSMIDVGQGDCILVHTPDGKDLLFDGGSSNVNKVYDKRIKPFLLSKGINKIDMVFVSHTDADHVNGLTELMGECDSPSVNLGNIKVGRLVMPDVDNDLKDEFYNELLASAKESNVKVDFASAGVSYTGNGFELLCLSPDSDDHSLDKNELSAVFKFRAGDFSMLFTGDMTEESERKLLLDDADLNADILKAAHHGSNTSNSAEFLDAVSPELCIVSCGVNNRYGHPGKETMERLEERGVTTIVTKERGQIFIEKKGGEYVVRTML